MNHGVIRVNICDSCVTYADFQGRKGDKESRDIQMRALRANVEILTFVRRDRTDYSLLISFLCTPAVLGSTSKQYCGNEGMVKVSQSF